MHVTRILTREHVLIKQVLDLLDASRRALETGIQVPEIFFEKAGTFCSEFADRYHHFKEEFLLFGLLSYKKQGELDTAMPDHLPTPAFLHRFARKMDRDICAMAEKDPYLNGMGTTLTCAILWNRTVFWVHSGDSRL